MNILTCPTEPGAMLPNIATMLREGSTRSNDGLIFRDRVGDAMRETQWAQFTQDVNTIAYNLKCAGFERGDKMVLFTPNRLEMLQLEMAVMAMGGIAVPIFAWFRAETARLLIGHSDARFLAAAGEAQTNQLSDDLKVDRIYVFDTGAGNNLRKAAPYQSLFEQKAPGNCMDFGADSDAICLNMYTSGTMGVPKCVQLTHRNILSQQAALSRVWDLDHTDRFLSYLPWHHSFGGIFEKYSALCSGAEITLEPSYGKSAPSIMEMWQQVKPTVFFSVPKVYQSLFDIMAGNDMLTTSFFHPELKFIFTAAAALPQRLSDEFERRNVKVLEGWGLTETSPCCTITDPSIRRESGLVGMPIPGVQVRIADEDEIQVLGPNVMVGYYNNAEANAAAFTQDGWFRTGDVGQITENGLRLIARKDRIFKLSNGEKVIPTDLEKAIETKCHYVQYAVVTGGGKDYPVALIFPNKKLFENPDAVIMPTEGCFCPRSLNELGRCMTTCLATANETIGQKFSKIRTAAIILDELSIDNSTLTPSMKVSPGNVLEKYRSHMLNLFGEHVPVDEEVYVVDLTQSQVNKEEKCTE